uniref:Uncharacterized protein n=1 Tax=Anguilla anguilla TaxID=7936 RepID=A0A0E9XUP7_ANGAN
MFCSFIARKKILVKKETKNHNNMKKNVTGSRNLCGKF